MDLIITSLLAAILIPIVMFTTGPLRIGLSVVFLLFFPGYVLITAFFPKKDDLGGIPRLALSFVLSAAICALIGFTLNFTIWGISLYPVLISLGSFTFIALVIAFYRRARLPKDERFKFRLRVKFQNLTGTRGLDKALIGILIILVVGTLGVLGYTIAYPREDEKFTEFYIISSAGTGLEYPSELMVGEQGQVTVGIVNHEQQVTTYRVEVDIGEEMVAKIDGITLASGDKLEELVTFTPTQAGQAQTINFNLFKDNGDIHYRQLQLIINVKALE